jgi:N-carbamoylputrescine amidase
MAQVAKACAVSVVVPIFERRAAGLYHNSLAVVGPDGDTLGVYRKMHIPDDPLFLEKFYFTPGDLGFRSIETPVGNLGTLICWDQWYPEAARLTAMQGAQLLVYPTAIGWHPKEKAEFGAAQLSAWQTMQRSHAIANGVFVIAVNRVGHEGPPDGGLDFWGHSFVCDPFGVVLAEAGELEEVLVVECDLARSEWVRQNWPFFRDRRIDAYGDLTARFSDRKQ